jgi:hypothetical protein
MAPAEPEITPKILLDHLQAMGQALTQQIGDMKDELRAAEQRLGHRVGRLEDRVDQLGGSLSRQIDGIDKRLDELEIAQLPRRVAALEQQ